MSITISDSECQMLVLQRDGILSGSIEFLSLIAHELGIPIYQCKDSLISATCLTLISSKLSEALNEHKRNRVLIAGTYLEEQVTVCALHALSIGYEVFLLNDCVEARTLDHVHAFNMRLFQAGVVPTTLRQLLYEWISSEERPDRQAQLDQLLVQIEKVV